jgi:hypothetical protein
VVRIFLRAANKAKKKKRNCSQRNFSLSNTLPRKRNTIITSKGTIEKLTKNNSLLEGPPPMLVFTFMSHSNLIKQFFFFFVDELLDCGERKRRGGYFKFENMWLKFEGFVD